MKSRVKLRMCHLSFRFLASVRNYLILCLMCGMCMQAWMYMWVHTYVGLWDVSLSEASGLVRLQNALPSGLVCFYVCWSRCSLTADSLKVWTVWYFWIAVCLHAWQTELNAHFQDCLSKKGMTGGQCQDFHGVSISNTTINIPYNKNLNNNQ